MNHIVSMIKFYANINLLVFPDFRLYHDKFNDLNA